ncbi:MAG: hypothetical protein J5U17_07385 [Candidatus Methanoperedens sp.]|nr:hypothetical protein [Candidatus Methanoperedens sp.]MCE8427608.1 hypothetical protein [Candidatus Methanoperedens sp.]
MKLWMALYAMVWIALIEFLLVMTPGGSSVLIYLHSILGIAIIGLAFYNFSGIRRTRVMDRVKRIAQASYNISVTAGISGVLIFFDIGNTSVIPVINVSIYGLILFYHVICAFAIITQAAAIAIAHDMWEEKEFEKETEPGVVPPHPMQQKYPNK